MDDLSYVLDEISSYAILTMDGFVVGTNAQFERLLEYTHEETIGKKYNYFINTESWTKEYFDSIQEVLKNGKVWRGEVEARKKSNTKFWAQMILIPLLDNSKKTDRVLAFCIDISEDKVLRDRIEFLAYHDEITGLVNRSYMTDFLHRIINETPTISIFMYVLHVNPYQDFVRHMGHERAAEILQEVTKRLRTIETDQLIMSYSEVNEFIICAVNQEPYKIQMLAEKIVGVFAEPFYMSNELHVVLRVQIGASIYPLTAKSVGELYRMALIALHRIPEQKKFPVSIYSTNANMESYKTFSLANGIHDAVRLGEFEMWYQPKLNLQTMKLERAESLLRWNHPEWGIIHAAEFMAVIQDAGLLSEVNIWAFHTVCQTMQSWKQKGWQVPLIAFNIPSSALIQVGLENNILAVLDQYQLQVVDIELEITETDKVQDQSAIIKMMKILRQHGLHLAIDGSGYSVFENIRRFPSNVIKFDKDFTNEIPNDSIAAMIAQSVVNLAHSLEMVVVAKGIEAEEQLSAIRALNVDFGQGYLWSPAIPAIDFEKIIAQPDEWLSSFSKPSIPYVGPDRREFFRVVIDSGMLGQLSLFAVKEKLINSGKSEVVVENIGPGGLSILTTLRLPARADFRLKISMKLSDQIFSYIGHIVWIKEHGRDILRYGLQFDMEESARHEFIKLLNQLAIHLRKSSHMTKEYDLLQTDKYSLLLKPKMVN
jgi:diguanylate cyclase (GGDEF)-like protein/PAS domain S-box-containing protein